MPLHTRPHCGQHSSEQADRQRGFPVDIPRPTLADRYGSAVLQHGHTAVPNLLLEHYIPMGISDAEVLILIHLLSYWWGNDEPCPAVGTLATRVGKTDRQVQHLLASLRNKGFLGSRPRQDRRGGQMSNTYDLNPLLRAIESRVLDQKTGEHGGGQMTEVARLGLQTPVQCGAGEPVQSAAPNVDTHEDQFVLGSITPPPGDMSAGTADRHGRESEDVASGPSSIPAGSGYDRLAALLDGVGRDLGDAAPRSSLTRAVRLMLKAGMAEEHMLPPIRAAAAQCRAALPSVVRQHPSGGPNGMPYFFATLEALLHKPPAGSDGACAPSRAPRLSDRARRPRVAGHAPPPPLANPPAAGGAMEASARPMDEHPLWADLLDDLAQVLAPTIFAERVAPLTARPGPEGALIVVAPTPFARSWVERQLGRQIRVALQQRCVAPLAVSVIVADATGLDATGLVDVVA